MKTKRFPVLVVLVICTHAVTGCASDVSNNAVFRGGYCVGERYLVRKVLAVDDCGVVSGFDVDLGPDGKGNRDTGFISVLLPKDEIQIVRILLERNPENGKYIHPMASVLNGELEGRELDLMFVSEEYEEVKDTLWWWRSSVGLLRANTNCFIGPLRDNGNDAGTANTPTQATNTVSNSTNR
jgi:hypothetical protein